MSDAPKPEKVAIGAAAMLGALTSLASVVTTAVRSKVTATVLGPSGVGISAELLQLVTLVFAPAALFAGPVLLTAIATELETHRPGSSVRAALSWTLVAAVAGTVFLMAIGPIAYPGEWEPRFFLYLALAAGALTLTTWTNVATQSLVAAQRLKDTATLHLGLLLVSGVASIALTVFFGLTGQFVAGLLAPLVMVGPTVWFAAKSPSWPRPLRLELDRGYVALAFRFGLASFVSMLTLQGALYVLRWQLELSGGTELNGQFQAAWTIGSTYLGAVLGGIGNYVFPRFAAARGPEQLQAEVDGASDFVLKTAPPLVFVAIALASVGLRVLYDTRFAVAEDILTWQLVGDLAKCLSWVYAGPLLFQGKLRVFVAVEVFAAVLLGGLPWVLVPLLGAQGVGVAYATMYVLYLGVTALAMRRALGVRAKPKHFGPVLAAMGFAGAMVALGLPLWARGALLVAAVVLAARSGLLRDVGNAVVRRVRRFMPAKPPPGAGAA